MLIRVCLKSLRIGQSATKSRTEKSSSTSVLHVGQVSEMGDTFMVKIWSNLIGNYKKNYFVY